MQIGYFSLSLKLHTVSKIFCYGRYNYKNVLSENPVRAFSEAFEITQTFVLQIYRLPTKSFSHLYV